ncbi:MAG: hypothetical protein OEV28_13290, partial [Nitrospirota bacterium]|nr:hypothetical protein [Nitrospirota bacterium]
MDRAVRYEDPLEKFLEEQRKGVIAGEGCQSSDEQEVQFVDIDLELVNLDDAVDLVKQVLESAGAPVGSELRFERDGVEESVPFGVIEGVAVYIDGQNLPNEVYEQWDIEELAEEIDEAMAGTGEIRGAWSGEEETALYLYGPSAETIFSMLQPLLTRHPLCQNARVVLRHGNPALNPVTVRIPWLADNRAEDASF